MNLPKQNKKQETTAVIVMILLLAIVWLVSKFVLGINFSLMEHGGYVAFGYHEISGDEIWAMSFDSFTGSISRKGTFPKEAKRRMLIHSETGQEELTLEIACGDVTENFTLDDNTLDLTIPGDDAAFTLSLSGKDIRSGYFSAVWE